MTHADEKRAAHERSDVALRAYRHIEKISRSDRPDQAKAVMSTASTQKANKRSGDEGPAPC